MNYRKQLDLMLSAKQTPRSIVNSPVNIGLKFLAHYAEIHFVLFDLERV